MANNFNDFSNREHVLLPKRECLVWNGWYLHGNHQMEGFRLSEYSRCTNLLAKNITDFCALCFLKNPQCGLIIRISVANYQHGISTDHKI